MKCVRALSAEDMVRVAEQALLRRILLKPAEVLGVVAGTQQASGSTNFMRLHVVTAEEAQQVAHPKKRSALRH
jgi:hypothetical protein